MTDMPDAFHAARTAMIKSLADITDPLERNDSVKRAEELVGQDFKELKASVANDLHEHHSWRAVGRLLGVSGSRAEQISRCAR